MADTSSDSLKQMFNVGMDLHAEAAKASVEAWKTWVDHLSKYVDTAVEGAQTVRDDPDKTSEVVKKMTVLGKEHVEAYSQLSTRLAHNFVDGVGRLADAGKTEPKPAARKAKPAARKAKPAAQAKKPAARAKKPAAKKPAARTRKPATRKRS